MRTNLPIMYDDHGEVPLDTPFEQLRPSDITFYLEMDTRVGKKTCRQTCEHCFYIREPEAQNRVLDLMEGRQLLARLRSQGYTVFPMISDTFAHEGEFLRLFGDRAGASPVHEVRQGDHELPQMMGSGEAWTSGAHLLDDDWRRHLENAIAHGFGTVTITFHGVPDEGLQLLPREDYPIKGVFSGHDCEIVLDRIKEFNRELAARGGGGIQRVAVNLTITVGRHNNGRARLLRYLRYFEKHGVTVARFNRYKAHGGRLPHLAMNADEIAQFYRDIRSIHQKEELALQLAVSEDFGTNGIEVMEFPQHTGWCRAGHQFFTIVGESVTLLGEKDGVVRERIGVIAACLEIYKPFAGEIIRSTVKATGAVDYEVVFFPEVIARLQRMRHDGTLRDGCWAPEYSRWHEKQKKKPQRRMSAGEAVRLVVLAAKGG